MFNDCQENMSGLRLASQMRDVRLVHMIGGVFVRISLQPPECPLMLVPSAVDAEPDSFTTEILMDSCEGALYSCAYEQEHRNYSSVFTIEIVCTLVITDCGHT